MLPTLICLGLPQCDHGLCCCVNRYWRIVDCAEDLAYCLFYYSGAASAAGLSYAGAVLATRDGLWPGAYTERIHAALRQTGIEPWELSMPDNSRCADAPLKV